MRAYFLSLFRTNAAHRSCPLFCRPPRHVAPDQPADRADPDRQPPADLARRPRAPHEDAPRRRQPARPGAPRRAAHRRGPDRAGGARPEADAPVHQHPAAIERRRRHPREPHVSDARGSDGARAIRHRQRADAARPAPAGGHARGAHPSARRRARCRRGRLRRHRRRGTRHGGSRHQPRAARANARLAQRRSARTPGGGDRYAGARRELRPCLRARAGLARPHGGVAGAEPGLRQRLRRRRRRRRHQRGTLARASQHRRRVRPHAAQPRRPAVLVRGDRLLGSAHLESRDADALLRPRAARGGRRRSAVHDRRFDRARCRRRRVTSASVSAASSTSSIRSVCSSAARSWRRGISWGAPCAPDWPSAR